LSHFYSEIQGNRGEATRCGSAGSGIRSNAKGWSSGVVVRGYIDQETDSDVFTIQMTSGSGGGYSSKFIGKVILVDNVPHFIPSEELVEAIRLKFPFTSS